MEKWICLFRYVVLYMFIRYTYMHTYRCICSVYTYIWMYVYLSWHVWECCALVKRNKGIFVCTLWQALRHTSVSYLILFNPHSNTG